MHVCNLLTGGQAISAVIGVCIRLAVGVQYPYVTSALGMSLALVAMQLTATTHPPGELGGDTQQAARVFGVYLLAVRGALMCDTHMVSLLLSVLLGIQ